MSLSGRIVALAFCVAACAGPMAVAEEPLKVEVPAGSETIVDIVLQGHADEPVELVLEAGSLAGGFGLSLIDSADKPFHRLRLDERRARLRVVAPANCEVETQRAALAIGSARSGRSISLGFEVVAVPSLSSCGTAVSFRWFAGALTVVFAGLAGFATILLGTMTWQSNFLPLNKLALQFRKGPGIDPNGATTLGQLEACLPWWRRRWCWLRIGLGRTRYREAIVLRLRDGLQASLIDERKIGQEVWMGNLFALARRNGFELVGYADEQGRFEGELRSKNKPLVPREKVPPGALRLTDGHSVWEIDMGVR